MNISGGIIFEDSKDRYEIVIHEYKYPDDYIVDLYCKDTYGNRTVLFAREYVPSHITFSEFFNDTLKDMKNDADRGYKKHLERLKNGEIK